MDVKAIKKKINLCLLDLELAMSFQQKYTENVCSHS